MAVNYSGLSKVGGGTGSGPEVFVYLSAEARATVEGTDYFASGSDYGMKVGDIVIVVYTTGYVTTIHAVSAVDSDGNATINAAVLS